MSERLRKIEERLKAATPGPWVLDGWEIVGPPNPGGTAPLGVVAVQSTPRNDYEYDINPEYRVSRETREANLMLCAHAPTDLALLLRAVLMALRDAHHPIGMCSQFVPQGTIVPCTACEVRRVIDQREGPGPEGRA